MVVPMNPSSRRFPYMDRNGKVWPNPVHIIYLNQKGAFSARGRDARAEDPKRKTK